jgi:hypothetical protein
MKNQTIITQKIQQSDRILILFINQGKIEGINFLQYVDADFELISKFMHINKEVTNFVLNEFAKTDLTKNYPNLSYVFPSPDLIHIITLIDDMIWNYVSLKNEIQNKEADVVILKNQFKKLCTL